MDKSRKEKELLFLWGAQTHLSTDVFPQINRECQSYFDISTSREYLTEYQFEGLDGLKSYIEEVFGENNRVGDIKQVLFVSAMKNKPKQSNLKKRMDDNDMIPAYIYNF